MIHLRGDFADRTVAGINEHVGLTVKGPASFEKLTDAGEGIGIVQQWAMRLLSHPLPNQLRGRPETNDETVGFQRNKICFGRPKATAGGDNLVPPLYHFFHQLMLHGAKSIFAVLRKNLGDTFSGATFQPFVRIHELKPELQSQHAPNRGFSAPHEPDKGEIVDVTRVAHLSILRWMKSRPRKNNELDRA